MTIDIKAAETIAVGAAQKFTSGLLTLAQKAADEAKLERLRLADEAHRLEELRKAMDEERRCLDRGFAQLAEEQRAPLEVSDSLPGSLSPIRRQTRGEPVSPLDIEADAGAGRGFQWSLPLRGASTAPPAAVEDCQGMLARCSDEALLDVLMCRREATDVAGRGGRVLVDFRPSDLVAFLERLSDDGTQPKSWQEQTDRERLAYLLDRFGLQGWVYQDFALNLQAESLLAFRGRRYAVLPAASPDEATVMLDMYDVTVTVPPGWEVLTTGQHNLDDAMGELSKHGWGTSLLCVRNASGGFSSYRTKLYTHGGPSGSKVSSDSRVLQAVENGGRTEMFKFSKGMVLSGRLVICTSGTVR